MLRPLAFRQANQARAAIKAGHLIRRLQLFALGENEPIQNGKGRSKLVPVFMSPDQVRAAFGLLAKVLPDLNRVEFTGGEDIGKNAAGVTATQRVLDLFDSQLSPVASSLEYQRLMTEAPEGQRALPAPGEPVEGELMPR